MAKEKLYSLIDTVDNQNYELLYNLISDFIDKSQGFEDIVYEDELSSINLAKKQIENNEYIDVKDFAW